MLTALASTYLGERGHEGWGPAQGTQWPVLAGGRAVPSAQHSQGIQPSPRATVLTGSSGHHWRYFASY